MSVRFDPRGLGTRFGAEGASFKISSSSGFTLVETLIVIVVIGVLSMIAFPRFQDMTAQSNLRSARTKIVSLYAKARAVAIESSRTATLRVEGDRVYVIAQPRRTAGAGTIDTVTPAEDIWVQYGVRMNGDVDVRVAPTGLGLDAATLMITKGSHGDTISISRYGQVLK